MYTMGGDDHTTGGPCLQCVFYDLLLHKSKSYMSCLMRKPDSKFQASSHPLLCLYSSVCVGPGLKPRRPVFSCAAHIESFVR